MRTQLYIITVATDNDYYLPYLIESCKRHNKEIIILGYGEEWKGFTWRFELLLTFLKNTNPNDIICFVDGYDVICTRNLNELPDEFIRLKEQHNCKMICGSSVPQNLYYYYYNYLYFGLCKNKLLNAGNYIGYSKDIYAILNTIYKYNLTTTDDQLLLTKYCNKYKKDIYIDKKNELFWVPINSLVEIDKNSYIIKNNNVIVNNQRPFFVHGPAATYLDEIIIKLKYNYDYNNKVKDKIKNKLLKKTNVKEHLKNNYKIIIFILIVIVIFFIIIKLIKT
jgi:hypothetical protein